MSCIECMFSTKSQNRKLINSSVLSYFVFFVCVRLCVSVHFRLAVNRLSYCVWCARFDLFLFVFLFYSLRIRYFGGGSALVLCCVHHVCNVATRRVHVKRHIMTCMWHISDKPALINLNARELYCWFLYWYKYVHLVVFRPTFFLLLLFCFIWC